MKPIVKKLRALILEQGWQTAFASAIDDVQLHKVPSLMRIQSLNDYLQFIDDMVHWAPRELTDSRMVHDKLVEFYFFFCQPSLTALQSPIEPASTRQPHDRINELSPLTAWIVEYAQAWGAYLDTPQSAAHVDSFRTNPAFRWNDYMPPPSGYQTFNQDRKSVV